MIIQMNEIRMYSSIVLFPNVSNFECWEIKQNYMKTKTPGQLFLKGRYLVQTELHWPPNQSSKPFILSTI